MAVLAIQLLALRIEHSGYTVVPECEGVIAAVGASVRVAPGTAARGDRR